MRYTIITFSHLLMVTLLPSVLTTADEALNIANPKVHAYANPKEGRKGYSLASEKVNEFRLYDFYSRQANYYWGKKDAPPLLPAYPGLDAGMHGHWGKYSQNNHRDGRLNDQDMGSIVATRFQDKKEIIHKAVSLKLGDSNELSACYDPWTLTYRLVWSDGFVKFDPFRWGVSRGVRPEGNILWRHSGKWRKDQNPMSRSLDGLDYHGYYRHGSRVIFAYEYESLKILEHPWAQKESDGLLVFTRTIQYQKNARSEAKNPSIPLAEVPEDFKSIIVRKEIKGKHIYQWFHIEQEGFTQFIGIRAGTDESVKIVREDRSLKIQFGDDSREGLFKVYHFRTPLPSIEGKKKVIAGFEEHSIESLKKWVRGGPSQWPQKLVLKGQRAKANDSEAPYVVDRLPVPFENPFKSVMLLSGIDFFSNGKALVCTLMGDVWVVSGIDDDLKRVTWKRYAAGLYQPFGIDIIDDKVYILAKDMLHILHDYNGDDEVDFHENYANDWVETRGHTHVFGLDRDNKGNFYFPSYDVFYKLPPDGSGVQLMAKGFRNCMGLAVSPEGMVLASNQEGTWTPASGILEVTQDAHYGHKRKNEPISPAMCYIPRGVDNSTGGMAFVDSDRWGPLGKSLIGLSYGYGSHYLILLDKTVSPTQGAVVPLQGEFRAGVHRGRINPKDGQFYTVGCDGWGNYALDDGSLDRVRYTGKDIYIPSGFKVHRNGVRIDFRFELDSEAAQNAGNYFAQQWDYVYSQQYGSPEYSVKQPEKLGHDRLKVRRVQVLNSGKSIFVEMPYLLPSLQLHIQMKLKTKSGKAFETEIYPSPMALGKRFSFKGAHPPVVHKPEQFKLRMRERKQAPDKFNDPKLKPDRKYVIKTMSGLRYDKTTLFAKPGEVLQIELINEDGMPHNWVLVQPGAYEKVGLQSFKMLNDPKAFDKSYVPDGNDVIAHTRVVFPESRQTIKFRIPKVEGRYPFLCTFPGHWQSMVGQLLVSSKEISLADLEAGNEPKNTLEKQLLKEDPKKLAQDARSKGDGQRGKALFEDKKVSCSTCHAPKEGPRLGPELALKEEPRTDEFWVDSILKPSKEFKKGYEPIVILTNQGVMRSGFKVSEDGGSLSFKDPQEGGETIKFSKSDLLKIMPGKSSLMPEGLVNQLADRQQFLDLVKYVLDLKGS